MPSGRCVPSLRSPPPGRPKLAACSRQVGSWEVLRSQFPKCKCHRLWIGAPLKSRDQGQPPGHTACASAQGPILRWALHWVYCSVAAVVKFIIGWLLVLFCFNKGQACTGHHLVLGFTNYEAGPAWDLCPSLKLDKDWPVEIGWDLGWLATGLAPGQMPPWVRKYKETTGAKSNCWGKLQTTRYKTTKK